jgi:hypothetical protein
LLYARTKASQIRGYDSHKALDYSGGFHAPLRRRRNLVSAVSKDENRI